MKAKKNIIVATVALFILLILLSSFKPQRKEFVTNRTFEKHLDLLFEYEVTRYPARAEVSSFQPTQERLTLGVAVDPWSLNFGIIPAGDNFGTRFLSLGNLREKSVRINFEVYGNISPFVNFSKNNFILNPGENLTVEARFYASSAKIGNYSGEVDVVVKIPKYDFLYEIGLV